MKLYPKFICYMEVPRTNLFQELEIVSIEQVW